MQAFAPKAHPPLTEILGAQQAEKASAGLLERQEFRHVAAETIAAFPARRTKAVLWAGGDFGNFFPLQYYGRRDPAQGDFSATFLV